MQNVEVSADVAAPIERVFQVYTDHEGWARWAGVKEVVMRRRGDPHPNGVGAVRVIRARGFALEEEITGFEAPRRLSYRLVGGVPIRDHEGEVRFSPTEAGTRVTWEVRFRGAVPLAGPITAFILRRALADILDRLRAAV